jgi:hypothetical protein
VSQQFPGISRAALTMTLYNGGTNFLLNGIFDNVV